MTGRHDEETAFLNVDLDLRSRARLEPLVAAFGDQVSVLYVGSEGKGYGAHLELAASCRHNVDTLIQGLTTLVRRLPSPARKLWRHARSREFNIGIQAGLKPHSYEIRLKAETLTAVVGVGGTLVVTVYAPEVPAT